MAADTAGGKRKRRKWISLQQLQMLKKMHTLKTKTLDRLFSNVYAPEAMGALEKVAYYSAELGFAVSVITMETIVTSWRTLLWYRYGQRYWETSRLYSVKAIEGMPAIRATDGYVFDIVKRQLKIRELDMPKDAKVFRAKAEVYDPFLVLDFFCVSNQLTLLKVLDSNGLIWTLLLDDCSVDPGKWFIKLNMTEDNKT